jgi:transcriptional regulator with XRE-family HTH domain
MVSAVARETPTKMRQIRESKGLTQQQLADAAARPRTAVAAWENGRRMSPENRAVIAKVLGVPPAELGPAWNPEAPRPRRTGRNTDTSGAISHTDTDPLQSGTPLGQIGAFPMSELPDLALFDKLTGLWRALDPAERQELYATAARFIGETATRTRAKNE